MSKSKYAIGVDLGGTSVKIGIVSESGKIIKKTSIDTNAQNGPAAVISSIKNEEIVENVIVEQEQNIQFPNEQDTLTLVKSDLENQSIKISVELEDALSKLIASDQSQINKDSVDNFSDDTILSSVENTKLDNTQDGYVLSDNRLAVRKIKPNYSCEEFGKIVVRVWVNREGKTIKAEPGIRGTTESSSCLFKEAKYAALKTTAEIADATNNSANVKPSFDFNLFWINLNFFIRF